MSGGYLGDVNSELEVCKECEIPSDNVPFREVQRIVLAASIQANNYVEHHTRLIFINTNK